MAAALTIPEFLARSQALEASLRAVLPEYTLLHGQYENVRNEALPENNPAGNAGATDELWKSIGPASNVSRAPPCGPSPNRRGANKPNGAIRWIAAGGRLR